MAAVLESLQTYIDVLVSPKKRDQLADNLLGFALQKPYLAVSALRPPSAREPG